MWYHRVVGRNVAPIVDTWWQTETGGILITPLPGATKTKPGSATRPFFGIQPVLMDADGNEVEGAVSGNLCIKHPWPGRCAPFSEIIKGSRKPTSAPIQDTILLVMAAVGMKMDTTGSPEGLMMS